MAFSYCFLDVPLKSKSSSSRSFWPPEFYAFGLPPLGALMAWNSSLWASKSSPLRSYGGSSPTLVFPICIEYWRSLGLSFGYPKPPRFNPAIPPILYFCGGYSSRSLISGASYFALFRVISVFWSASCWIATALPMFNLLIPSRFEDCLPENWSSPIPLRWGIGILFIYYPYPPLPGNPSPGTLGPWLESCQFSPGWPSLNPPIFWFGFPPRPPSDSPGTLFWFLLFYAKFIYCS